MTDQSNSIYDYPKYYDLIYGSDWVAEYSFLNQCIQAYVDIPVRHIFEPACGTGRLLFRFGRDGFDVSGLDLNAKSIEYCNQRLEKHDLPPSAFVADMCEFQLEHSCQLAFNMINSFRHLQTNEQAVSHLECMRDSMDVGAIYVLGLHLSPTNGKTTDGESWSASKGFLTVNSTLWLVNRNLPERYEDYGMSIDVFTPTEQKRLEDQLRFRTYSADQFVELVESIDGLEIRAIHDFRYEIDQEIGLDESVEDAVFVMQRTPRAVENQAGQA